MKNLLFIIGMLPVLVLAQFDENEWRMLTYDSLFKLDKPSLSIGINNNSYVSDLNRLTNRNFPAHQNIGVSLGYVHPINKRIDLNFNAGYNQIGENAFYTVENFKGYYVGADAGVALKLFNEARVSPFFALGIGGGFFNTTEDSLSADGETYWQWDDGTIRNLPQSYTNTFIADEIPFDGVYESELSKGMSFYIPYSVGARMKITPQISTTLTYTFNILSSKHDGEDNMFDGLHQFKLSLGYVFGVKMPELPKEDSVIINFVVSDTLTGEPIEGATAYLWAVTDSGKVALDTAITDQMGIAKLYYPENLNTFEVSFEKEEYFPKSITLPEHSENVKTWKEQEPMIPVELRSTWEDKIVQGYVIDKFTNKPLDSVMVIFFENIDGVETPVDTTFTNKDGKFDFTIDHKGDYSMTLDKDQYKHKEFDIPEVDSKDDFQVFLDGLNPYTMEPEVKKGNKFKVDNIFFAFAKADPLPESYPILDNIVTFMKENPEVRIELGAHTDCVGKDKDNMKLSNARAKSCVDYLISKGISSDRLESQGYGESQILNGCYEEGQCTKEENQVNRRVEVKVL